MKTKLFSQIHAVILLSLVAVLSMTTMSARAADKKEAPGKSPPAQTSDEWKAADWKDPDKVLPIVAWEDIPLSDVVRVLRDVFHNESFDMLLPSQGIPASAPALDPTTGLPAPVKAISPGDITVTLLLQNVRASEIFIAMNLLFEANQTPVRWELLMNGRRPTALLRPTPRPNVDVPAPGQEQAKRSVFFVGDIVGDERDGGMNWAQFDETIAEVCQRVYRSGPAPKTEAHRGATLLIVTGNQEQIDFMRNMLEALKEKSKLDAARKAQSKPAEPRSNPSDAKAP